jgi:putative methyltransferase (TIGR04325 family)
MPPFLLRVLTGLFYGWHGSYSSWAEAKKKGTGYDSTSILEIVKKSSLKVKNGLAAYERDSVLFDNIEYSFPLLSGLMWIAAQKKGTLNILDFGGSLGSSYFQNKLFLDSLSSFSWNIVEQPDFVKTGMENFSDKNLHFFYTIEDCLKSVDIDVIILSSVLQYIDNPYDLLEHIKSTGIRFMIIDRTPFINTTDRITLQKVNPKIYKATYPCWFFNKEKFVSFISNGYNIILEFEAIDKANLISEFKGFILQRV